MLLRILGLILGVATCIVAGGLELWTDKTSFLIVLASMIGAFLLSGNSIKLLSIGYWGSLSRAQALKAAIGYKMMRSYSIVAALIGSMIGWLMALENVHNPPDLGPAMCLALLSSLYSFVYAYFIFLPAQANLERPFGFNDNSIVKSGLICVVIALMNVFIALLILSFSFWLKGESLGIKQAVGVGLFTLLEPTSLLLIAGGICSILLSSGQNIGNMFGALFASNATTPKLLEAAAAWRTIAASSLGVGAVLTLISTVIVLMTLVDPAELASAYANTMLTILYGLVIAFVVAMPIQSRLEQRAESAG